jgi:hypothetical protein
MSDAWLSKICDPSPWAAPRPLPGPVDEWDFEAHCALPGTGWE